MKFRALDIGPMSAQHRPDIVIFADMPTLYRHRPDMDMFAGMAILHFPKVQSISGFVGSVTAEKQRKMTRVAAEILP